uniref:Predicted protein n=1 Tax=Hordeum vulgare subsp. vulgare TaxID=112509 RepID=F2ELM8_HORVV|nr:predicted protein [Hordeum vulgare subsp. vulgare]
MRRRRDTSRGERRSQVQENRQYTISRQHLLYHPISTEVRGEARTGKARFCARFKSSFAHGTRGMFATFFAASI